MKRNTRFEVQVPVEGNDLDGIPSSWSTAGFAWGEFKTISGREYEQAQQMNSTTTHIIKTQYFKGATSAMRLVSNDRVFEVESVYNENERNMFSVWRCQEQD